MNSAQETKTRLASVHTTKKITKAMQLVATSKLRVAKAHLDGIQEYYMAVFDTFQDLLANVHDFSKIFPKNAKKSTFYVAITSDLGLCGAYNSNVLKLLKSQIGINDKVALLGNKGVTNFKARNLQADFIFPSIGDEPNYPIASSVAKEVIALYLTGKINAIKIIYTKFINSVTFQAEEIQILPINNDLKRKKSGFTAVTEFEPDAETVVRNAIPLYVSSLIFGAMVESKVSEMSSRRTAMENASDNADELIEKLNLEYNRVRQSSITQEISEIVGGTSD